MKIKMSILPLVCLFFDILQTSFMFFDKNIHATLSYLRKYAYTLGTLQAKNPYVIQYLLLSQVLKHIQSN